MSTLFLDTSYNQIAGLLSDQGAWLSMSDAAGQKSSAQLHAKLHELCPDPARLNGVLYVAGPGFYTGLRIAYGIAEVLRLQNLPVMSFYNYEVPHLLGRTDYTWVTKAYRGEVFIHTRGPEGALNRLVSEKEFLAAEWAGEIYIHHAQALDPQMAGKLAQAQETQALMVQRMPELWSALQREPAARELHYFRPPEEEFKPSV